MSYNQKVAAVKKNIFGPEDVIRSVYRKKLDFLIQSSIFFLGTSSYDEIFPYVADNLHKLTKAVVVTSEYLFPINATVIRAIKMKQDEKSKVQQVLGSKIVGMTFAVDLKTRNKFVKGRLTKVHGGIYELSFYRIPKTACKLIEKLLNIGDIHAMAFVVEKDFLGTAVIICKKGSPLEDERIVEAFINQSAIALKNKKTEQHLVEVLEKLENEKKHLQELEQKKDEFIAVASHELKTPLTSTKLYAELLKKDLGKYSDKRHRMYKRFVLNLSTQLDKMEKLVGDMLDVSKIEKGKLRFDKEIINLNRLVRSTLANYRLTVKSHTIASKGKVTENIQGDPDRIQQVLVNLLNNAVKYSPKGKKIIVQLGQVDKEAVIAVKDFGIGIPEKMKDRIFERYYRGDRRNGQGFGLGLYIASEIIVRHGGSIWFESKEGKGSVFYFTLPLNKK